VVGFAIAGIGVDAVQWGKIGQIVASWVVSPVLGGTVAFILMISIRRLILNTDNPFLSAKRWGPAYVFLVGFVISLVTLFKGLKHLELELSVPMSFLVAAIIGLVIAAIGWAMINRVRIDETANKDYHFASVEKVFVPMMLFTACGMAFAHGSNDVANGVGPLAAVYGLVTRITELTPTRGFSATMAAAATVVLASRTGMPVSTTHIAVGAVMGVGLARGIGALDLRVIGGIVVSWIVTLPIGGVLAALFFFTLKGIFT
jgi:PiT family inorganic phosphate transporter